jgi:hypothetical protein
MKEILKRLEYKTFKEYEKCEFLSKLQIPN